ncbi:hypothetical protein SAMN02910456_01129 [Ruminococcaceae bacterium YRB3002]|nr:hypothetical protein SAMN02910456_01129 [Ruminococcaceae bacterium YRB3002]
MRETVRKTYVKVTADFYPDGRLRPVVVTWEDGRKFVVDKIKDIRRAASLKAGGTGIRYTCIICGKMCYLFYEENYKWFVEEKVYVEG